MTAVTNTSNIAQPRQPTQKLTKHVFEFITEPATVYYAARVLTLSYAASISVPRALALNITCSAAAFTVTTIVTMAKELLKDATSKKPAEPL